MRLVISAVEADDGQAVTSLLRWLGRDARVARYGQVTVQPAARPPGAMGGSFDVISATLADGSAVAGIGSLVVAFRAWRDTRTHAPAFTIEKDGVTVTVNRGSEEELRQVLSALLPDSGTAGRGPAPETIRGETSGDEPAGSAEVPRRADRDG